MTHSLTARIVLPWESEEAYDARLVRFKTGLPCKSELDLELAERAAQASWLMDRALVADAERIVQEVQNSPEAVAAREEDEAELCGNRLLFDPRGPVELYPTLPFMHDEQRPSWSKDPEDPNSPRAIVVRMKRTGAGCRRLRWEWREMKGMLIDGMGWQSPEKFKAVRLLGLQPLRAGCTRMVGRIFMACHVLEPQFEDAFHELRCEMPPEKFKQFKIRLEKRKMEEITPKDKEAARAVLLKILNRELARIKKCEEEIEAKAAENARREPKTKSHDGSKIGEQIRRSHASCDRMMRRNMDAVHRYRRYENEGWGLVRLERQRKKDERMGILTGDQRIVMDEKGTIWNAHSCHRAL